MKRFGIAVATLGIVIAGLANANAETIFYDNFDRGNGTAPSSYLHTTTPTTVNPTFYPTGLAWVSTPGASHNLTTTANGGQEIGGWNAKLAFTPLANKQYTLTMTVGPTLQNALQVGFGIYNGSSMSDFNYLQQDVANMTWAKIGQINSYGTNINTNGGGTQLGTYSLSAGEGPGNVNTLELLMDTSAGLANAALEWKVNGTSKGTWTANVTGYNSFLFGRGDGPNDPNGTQISDVTLTVVPEPSLGALAIAMAGVAFAARRLRGRQLA